jgi:IS5 family transposase
VRWFLILNFPINYKLIAKKGIGLFLRLLQASGLGHIGHQLREFFVDKSSKSVAMRLTLA